MGRMQLGVSNETCAGLQETPHVKHAAGLQHILCCHGRHHVVCLHGCNPCICPARHCQQPATGVVNEAAALLCKVPRYMNIADARPCTHH